MARVTPRALIVILGLAACVAVVVTALLVADSRELRPQRVELDLPPTIATLPDAPQPLEDVVHGQRTELARGIDEEAYARARSQRDSLPRHGPRRMPSAWRGGRLDVRVVGDDDGSPVPGADVTLSISNVEEISVASRTTDAAGTAHFEGLPAESWMVKASAMGRREQRAWRVIGPTWTARELEIRLEMRRELAVRLLDDAGRELTRDDFESLFGHRDAVTVAATLACGPVGSSLEPGNRRGGESDVRGPIAGTVSWRLTVEGTWARCVQALYGDTTLGCAPLEADARAVDVHIGGEVIRELLLPLPVLVLGELDGFPVAGALVRFESVRIGASVEVLTDGAGRARVDAPLAGGTPFTVSAAGFRTTRGELVRRLGAQMLVRLAPGHRIQGVLRDENDRPLVRATIALHEADESGARLARGAPTLLRTGPDGAFAFDGLESRCYAVGGRGDLRTESGEVDRPADFVFVDCREKDALDVVVRRAAIPRAGSRSGSSTPRWMAARLRAEPGERTMRAMGRSLLVGLALAVIAFAAATWFATGPDPEVVGVGVDAPSIASPRSAARSADEILATAPVGAADSMRAPSDVRASASRTGPGTLDVQVVRDEDGAPLEGVLVNAQWLGEEDSRRTATTDAEGRVRFAGLAVGTWTLSAGAAGRKTDWRNERLRTAAPAADVRL